MATLLHNLEQTETKRIEIENIKNDILEKYKNGIYVKNINGIDDLIRYLRYTFTLKESDLHYFYRVRKFNTDNFNEIIPYSNRNELIYPSDQDINRMNLKGEKILYTSINPITAMAESRLKEGDYFQLTKFKLKSDIRYYELGIFSEMYFNITSINYRDDFFKGFTGVVEFDDRLVKYNSALENLICDFLYDKKEGSDPYEAYIVPAHISKSIFELLCVEAIKYPTTLNRYGTNFVFNEKGTSELDIVHSSVMVIEKKYSSGFYKLKSLYESSSCKDPHNITFEES